VAARLDKRRTKLAGRFQESRFATAESVDADRDITGEALDRLFLVLRQQGREIRPSPTARATGPAEGGPRQGAPEVPDTC
jgi:hypothetical protein